MGGTGLEIVTWLGDIGGGAGMLAFRRTSNPQKRALSMFTDKHNFGGYINVEGDIAAYLVGRNVNNFQSVPGVSLKDSDYISDALKEYIIPNNPTNNEWNNRVSNFITMLGGNLNGTVITNEQDFEKKLAEQMQMFAQWYAISIRAGGKSIDMSETSAHFEGVAKEMAKIFVHTLKSALTNPKKSIKTAGVDHDPTPKGTPYKKWSIDDQYEKYKKDIEDWLNKF